MTEPLQEERPRTEVIWAPWAGPQTEFMRATEFEVLFGGAKGPGKSDCLLMAATRQTHRPRYKALILRETLVEVQELIDRSHRLFPQLAGAPSWNGNEHRWTWPSGAVVEFGGVARPEDTKRYHGKEFAFIGFDEVGNVPDERTWELLAAECRCPDPQVIRMMRGSANPGKAGHAWVRRRFVQPCGADGATVHWETVRLDDGSEVDIARRYIPAKVTDNPVYANDPLYMAQLMKLPEVLRRQLLYGDWDAGVGAALDELSHARHLVEPFAIPPHWEQFGAFDWGYAHPWVFGWFAADEDGSLWLVDAVKGRQDKPWEIASAIRDHVPVERLRYIHAGHDCWAEHRAHGENTPTVAETFAEHGIVLSRANIDRRAGLNNLRHYTAWKGMLLTPDGRRLDGDPGLRFFDTPTNRWGFEQLLGIIVDPLNVEKPLKVDADPVTGEGGDDYFDMVRYGAASRPMRARSNWRDQPVQAWAPATLTYEHEHRYRDKPLPVGRGKGWRPPGSTF
jgi:hypothetical protein